MICLYRMFGRAFLLYFFTKLRGWIGCNHKILFDFTALTKREAVLMERKSEFQSKIETDVINYPLYIKFTSLKSLSSSSFLILIVFYFIVLTSRYRSFSPFENSYLGFEALFLAFARCGGNGPEFLSSIF